ncbi:arginine/serine-rich splicing factor [Striga asiatica]|uniref:Arginine/serine-rich splicing factor n=1 Tax=Striga asiatica TaxID=4170 RepID=A0A5A7QMJ2_STRAF|nr:arginine/serine-rich splicing factor [Striga asiatica]
MRGWPKLQSNMVKCKNMILCLIGLYIGFSFIYFEDKHDAVDAILGFDDIPFRHDRRRLSVELARSEHGWHHDGRAANQRPTRTLFVIKFDLIHTREYDVERPFGKVFSTFNAVERCRIGLSLYAWSMCIEVRSTYSVDRFDHQAGFGRGTAGVLFSASIGACGNLAAGGSHRSASLRIRERSSAALSRPTVEVSRAAGCSSVSVLLRSLLGGCRVCLTAPPLMSPVRWVEAHVEQTIVCLTPLKRLSTVTLLSTFICTSSTTIFPQKKSCKNKGSRARPFKDVCRSS